MTLEYEGVRFYRGRYWMTKVNGKTVYLHRIIAERYIPNPHNKPEVNHINGDKFDNRTENLEWVTHRENMQHAHRTKLINVAHGLRVNTAKLNETQVSEIRRKFKPRVYTYQMLSDEYGISKRTVWAIVSNQIWKSVKI